MYRSLYRKYRPEAFYDVVGQEHITNTIKNEIITGKTAHAYIFTGTRGTGKTSCAKIFAKAVNCLEPKNGNPCLECEVCKMIADNEVMDIIEIDAASNNGVDSVRELRDEVIYSPSVTRKKVYIIDEVHMLTNQAFNALLKTLEEPPPHVIFILATTEIHKVPPTILSRCQRFDFRRLRADEIFEHIKTICDREEILYSDEGLQYISKLADGSVRDGLSILEQCAGMGEKITLELVESLTKTAGRAYLFQTVGAIQKKSFKDCLLILNELYYGSKDISVFAGELAAFLRDMMIVKTVDNFDGLVFYGRAELDELLSVAKSFTLQEILYCIDCLQITLDRLPRTANKKLELEVCFLKMVKPQTADAATGERPAAANAEEKRCERSDDIVKNSPAVKREAENESPKPPVLEEADGAAENAELRPGAQKPEIKDAEGVWKKLIAELKNCGRMDLWAVLSGTAAAAEGTTVEIQTDNNAVSALLKNSENREFITALLQKLSGKSFNIRVNDGVKTAVEEDPFSELIKNNKNEIEFI